MFSQEVMNVFWQTVTVTIKGMSGIFIFMGIFYALIVVIDKLFPKELESNSD